MHLATRKLIHDIDEFAEKKLGISADTLMQNAGKSAADVILSLTKEGERVLVLCGKGKNGGDGYVVALQLFECGRYVTVFESEADSRDASSELYRTKLKKKIKLIHPLSDKEKLIGASSQAEVIVDAVFGVGFHGYLPECEAQALGIVNRSKAKRIAIDCPSGVDSDSGRVSPGTFAADMTLTMAYVKRGMLCYPAKEYCGEIHVCDIGIDKNEVEKNILMDCHTVDEGMIRKYVLNRPADSHKGTYGRLMLVCGSDGMSGAAVLACEGALRMGVGLCELVCTRSVADIVASYCPEVIFTVVPPLSEWDNNVYEKLLLHSVDADAILIGCGLGQHPNAERLIELLSTIAGCPMIIDADGLNSLDGRTTLLEEAVRDIVITPHPKEFARLVCGNVEDVQWDRYNATVSLSEKCSVTVLLKGAATVICASDKNKYINQTGNSGLARAGAGDVLAGMIGALLAQGIPSGVSAALGAHIHGAAAELLCREYSEAGMLVRDIPMAAARYLASLANK